MRINACEKTISAVADPESEPIRKDAEAIRKADPKGILSSGQLHPQLVQKTEHLIEKAARRGLNLYVFEGFRSLKRQAELLAGGRNVTRAKPGQSLHNYGLAVDIVFKDAKGRPSWAETHDWRTLGRLGKEEGLIWGGDWRTLKDRAHFQLNASLPSDF